MVKMFRVPVKRSVFGYMEVYAEHEEQARHYVHQELVLKENDTFFEPVHESVEISTATDISDEEGEEDEDDTDIQHE